MPQFSAGAEAPALRTSGPEPSGRRRLRFQRDARKTLDMSTVSELFAPVSGEVMERNEGLGESPQWVNDDPYGDGWMLTADSPGNSAPANRSPTETGSGARFPSLVDTMKVPTEWAIGSSGSSWYATARVNATLRASL